MRDVVKFYKADRGFGFIVLDDPGADQFVHRRQIERAGYCALVEGQRSEFEIGTNSRTGRSEAINLQLLEPIISRKLVVEDREAHRLLAESAFLKAPR